MTTTSQADLLKQSDRIYDRYVRPLEQDHRGEYAAVAADGRLVLASTLPAVLEQAERALLPESFVFKVGAVAVDVWR